MKNIKVGILVGSLRKNSYSKAIADWFVNQNTQGITWEILDISKLTIYNEDFDSIQIEAYEEFRNSVKSVDAFLFITPEYNRSIPAVLKNAIDIASRPYGQNAWARKPGAIISQSIGNMGGFGASNHLRQVLNILDVYTMNHPECYIAHSSEHISADGAIAEKTSSFLGGFLSAYVAWIEKFAK